MKRIMVPIILVLSLWVGWSKLPKERVLQSQPELEWVDVKVDNLSDWDPYTPEERAKFKADRKRRGRDTFGLEVANDGTNIVLVTHDYSARDGSNKRLIYPLTNRFVQVSFFYNGEIEVDRTKGSVREVEGNLNLSHSRGFWITPNEPYPGENILHYSNITVIHSGEWERVVSVQ